MCELLVFWNVHNDKVVPWLLNLLHIPWKTRCYQQVEEKTCLVTISYDLLELDQVFSQKRKKIKIEETTRQQEKTTNQQSLENKNEDKENKTP